MQQKIEHAIRQALEARQQAELCMDNRVRGEWFKIAETWERIAREAEEIQRAQEAALLDDFAA